MNRWLATIWYQSSTILYLSVAFLSFSFGFYSSFPASYQSQLVPTEVPTIPADATLTSDIWLDNQKYLEKAQGLTLVTEEQADSPPIRYWCPREHLEWGIIDFTFPTDASRNVSRAILRHETLVFGLLDPLAQAEMLIDKGRGYQLVGQLASGAMLKFPQFIDVTDWINEDGELKIRYRIRAARLIFHPTPNDPVGFAGAQASRSLKGGPEVMELKVWYD